MYSTAMTNENSTASATTSDPSSPLIPNLPDDISIQCIARIPSPYHSVPSTVSKSWRSIIRSPQFFKTRSLLRSTQQSLYLNISVGYSTKWYLLHQNPKVCKNPNFLSLLPPLQSQPFGVAAFAVLGPKIYVIGGVTYDDDDLSNDMWIFDCRFSTWEIGPKMRLGRKCAAARVVNGKIYVIGGYVVDNFMNYKNWIEVYDPVVGVWNFISSPVNEWMDTSCIRDGRIYGRMVGVNGDVVVYNVVTGEWESSVPTKWRDVYFYEYGAVVDGVLYDRSMGKIAAYNVEKDVWNDVKGVDNNIFKRLTSITMASLNGNLCVVWVRTSESLKEEEDEIMCAEIEVRKDDVGEGFTGSVLWSDLILSVPFPLGDVDQILVVDL